MGNSTSVAAGRRSKKLGDWGSSRPVRHRKRGERGGPGDEAMGILIDRENREDELGMWPPARRGCRGLRPGGNAE